VAEYAKPEGLAYLEARAKEGDLWEKGRRVEAGRGSSGFLRQAQDDSKNKQQIKTGNNVKQAKAKCGGSLHCAGLRSG